MVMPFSEKEKTEEKLRNWHKETFLYKITSINQRSFPISGNFCHAKTSWGFYLTFHCAKAIYFPFMSGCYFQYFAACMTPCGHVSQVLWDWDSAKKTPIQDPWDSKSLLFWNIGFLCCFFFCNVLFRNKTYKRKILLYLFFFFFLEIKLEVSVWKTKQKMRRWLHIHMHPGSIGWTPWI